MLSTLLRIDSQTFFQIWFTLVQNYIAKTRKSIFSITFLRKANQKLRKFFFNQKPHKSNKHLLCHNLLSKSELGHKCFWFVLFANFDDSKPRKWLYAFFYLFFFANFDHKIIVNIVSNCTCFYLFFFIILLNRHGLTWFYFA